MISPSFFKVSESLGIKESAKWGSSSSLRQVSANIALEAFLIRPSSFLGLSCTVLQQPTSSLVSPVTDGEGGGEGRAAMDSLLNFKCHTVNSSGSPASQLSKVSHRLLNMPLDVANRGSKPSVCSGRTKLAVLVQLFAKLLA